MSTPCGWGSQAWTHDGVDVDLFRAVPLSSSLVAGQLSTLSFSLEYLDAGTWSSSATNEWTALAWSQLVEYHGARVHVNIVSADGDDFFHVHPEFTGFDVSSDPTALGVLVTHCDALAHGCAKSVSPHAAAAARGAAAASSSVQRRARISPCFVGSSKWQED